MADKTTPKSDPNPEASQDVYEIATGTVAGPTARRISESFKEFVQRRAAEDAGNNWEITAGQLDKMLAAVSVDDIMDSDEFGTHQGKDLDGFEFTVHPQQFRYAVSSDEFDATLGAYMQFRAIALMDYEAEHIHVGEEVLISTGAPLVMGKLRTLEANGHLPMGLKLVVGGGKGVLRLVRAPRRAVPGQTA